MSVDDRMTAVTAHLRALEPSRDTPVELVRRTVELLPAMAAAAAELEASRRICAGAAWPGIRVGSDALAAASLRCAESLWQALGDERPPAHGPVPPRRDGPWDPPSATQDVATQVSRLLRAYDSGDPDAVSELLLETVHQVMALHVRAAEGVQVAAEPPQDTARWPHVAG